MHELFANTGVQLLCFPIRGVPTRDLPRDWQVYEGPAGDGKERKPYIQWLIRDNRLFLAVDTTCGDPEAGHFASAGTLKEVEPVTLAALPGPNGVPIVLKDCSFRLRALGAGDSRPVHLIVDFGNSRTGALLLEVSGEVSSDQEMLPFELHNRRLLDAWDARGQPQSLRGSRWFSSKTHWCTTPFQPVGSIFKTVHRVTTRRGVLWNREEVEAYQEEIETRLFEDLSMVRMGREVEAFFSGGLRTGVSSPKRYLWAGDDAWLEGEDWHMADLTGRVQKTPGVNLARLEGPLLKHLFEDDLDPLFDEMSSTVAEGKKVQSNAAPISPRHPPRVLMVAALYELLCQVYTHVNSSPYRIATGRPAHTRHLASLTLTYPSGSILYERDRYLRQAKKAAHIFHKTLGRMQRETPLVNLSLDEASAVHLAYIWSEVKPLGLQTRIWFQLASREPAEVAPPVSPNEPAPQTARPQARPGPLRARQAPNPAARATSQTDGPPRDLRIACIDIGGGTTDLMIARYTFRTEAGVEDEIVGEILHRDGIPVAGDRLVQRLLEQILLPQLREAVGMEPKDMQFFFGPQTPENRRYRGARIQWMNQLLVPLAIDYLEIAAGDNGEPDAEWCDVPAPGSEQSSADLDILRTMQRTINERFVQAQIDLEHGLGLRYERERFERVVQDVFYELLLDLCERIVKEGADIVLLAGQPSRLRAVQDLVRLLLPLPPARIIPMHGYYAGTWYPYQDKDGNSPGCILDAKSPVVVGAAVHFLANHGMLPQFRFKMEDRARKESYYWGVMRDEISGIPRSRVLFESGCREETTRTLPLEGKRLLIGRRYNDEESAYASPVYLLKLETENRLAPSRVEVVLRKTRHPDTNEEILELDSASGSVAGKDAVAGENVKLEWRTLSDEHFFLDSGSLDSIDLGSGQ